MRRLGWLAAAAFLAGCPGIRTGIVRAVVVDRSSGNPDPEPVPGATCALDEGAFSADTDDRGQLSLSGAPSGAHTLICRHTAGDGTLWAAFVDVDLPREAGRGGLLDLGEIELFQVLAPRSPNASPEVRGATVTWTAPASTGGQPVLEYEIGADPPGPTITVPGDQTSAAISGLQDGTAYAFTITPRSVFGDSPSARTPPVTTPRTPSPPRRVRAEPAVLGGKVSWWTPADAGGLPIAGYRVTASPGGAGIVVPPGAHTAVLTGLPAGTAYTFTVTALNAAGEGMPSSSSAPVSPLQPSDVSSLTAPPAAGGCVALDYVLQQPAGLPADVIVELDDGSGFRRATQASTTSEGVAARGSGPHTFLWNSSRDLPARNATVRLRIGAAIGGVRGAPREIAALAVSNGFGLASPSPFPGGVAPGDVAAADFNRDGRLDVALASTGADQVAVLPGLGDGTFGAALTSPGGPTPGALAAADLDGDGRMDLVTASAAGGPIVSVLLGNGNGTFQPPVTYPAANGTRAVAVADVNGDGR
ncbi:MAG TPA: FG-GAP-like repeat-containing protein, partial [Myxococcales bacterium]|nr:FG-GAP-like repeat-containing protein [Myxococcales bacterium]